MIKLEKLEVKNFLSIGNDPVIIDFKTGLNIITGRNKDNGGDRTNGIGKSSIIDAIYYSWFGNTLRDLKKSEIINDITKKDCSITHEFSKDDVQYKIVRTLKSSTCQFFIDGKEVTRDSIANTEEYIKTTLQIDEASFRNCVIMSIGGTIPFMAQKKIDRKNYIEGIFDINIFSEISNQVRKESNKMKTDIEILISNISNKKTSIEKYQLASDSFDQNNKQQINELLKDLKINQDKLKNKKYNVDEKSIFFDAIKNFDEKINKVKEKNTEISDKQRKIDKQITQFEFEINNRNKIISKLIRGGECPVCFRSIDDNALEHLSVHENKLKTEISEYSEKIKKLNEGIVKCQNNLEKIGEMLTTLKTKRKENEKKLQEFNIIDSDIRHLTQEQKSLEGQIQKLKTSENGFKELLTTTEKELKELTTQYDELCVEQKVLNIVSLVYGDKGVKSYIVKKVLDVLNTKIAYYLSKMNINCNIVFDEFFGETITTKKGTIRSYSSFSSGERRSIDISIMFAFMDLQKLIGKFHIDTNFYDELIDSSLDEDGVDYVLDILREKIKSENKKIYLITHRKEAAKFAEGETIMLEKSNGITKRV